MMVTSWFVARCSATTRQWLSEPPAISAPKRWMTQASFIARSLWLRFGLAAKAGVFDREILDARKQHGVDPLLAPEVFLAVLEQPSGHRQQQPALDQQDDSADHRTMGRQAQVGLQLPLDIAVEQLGQQQRVGVALVDRAAENRADTFEQRFILVLGGAASLEDVASQAIPDVPLDVVHQRPGADGGH